MLTAQHVMTKTPACCLANASLQDVARAMVEQDCGAIPVVENTQSMRLVGIITDRDITCRSVARGKNPLEMTAQECMSSPPITVTPETTLEECCNIMERSQVRRIPVVDAQGVCFGIVSQSHIVKHVPELQIAQVLKGISRPTVESSAVAAQ